MIRRLLAALLAALVVVDVWRWLRDAPDPEPEPFAEPWGDQ